MGGGEQPSAPARCGVLLRGARVGNAGEELCVGSKGANEDKRTRRRGKGYEDSVLAGAGPFDRSMYVANGARARARNWTLASEAI